MSPCRLENRAAIAVIPSAGGRHPRARLRCPVRARSRSARKVPADDRHHVPQLLGWTERDELRARLRLTRDMAGRAVKDVARLIRLVVVAVTKCHPSTGHDSPV